jgi:phage terminase large subunit GpA-like protein
VTRWEKRRERNEALDCRIYARAAAATLRLETWGEKRWADLEDSLTVEAVIPRAPRAMVRPSTPVPQFRPMRANEGFLE